MSTCPPVHLLISRQLLGIPMRGDPALQHLMSIHFSWPRLGAALLGEGRQAMLYFVFSRQLVAVVVAHDLNRGEFVVQVGEVCLEPEAVWTGNSVHCASAGMLSSRNCPQHTQPLALLLLLWIISTAAGPLSKNLCKRKKSSANRSVAANSFATRCQQLTSVPSTVYCPLPFA